MSLVLLTTAAHALTLSERSVESVEPGVTLTRYRTTSPATDLYVVTVDLCASDVYLDATRAPSSTRTAGAWGADQDATLSTNGDFYKTDPVRVYGDAVGGGVRWPAAQSGLASSASSEWYWEHYGWIAFLHDGVEFTHTGWVKENVDGLAEGWRNDTPRPAPPPGTIALVSGFPELVVEGRAMTCADPTASSCFPDRSDMRARHPRTAMGLTQDRATLILAVADGRTSTNAGLYGSELADAMRQLGAWEAFNLDGGGSTQLWIDGTGYANDTAGNNNGGGTRAVANHWGVFAGGRSWLPGRPGHCASALACATLPPEGGTVDDGGACFRTFGPQQYWRTESTGTDGGLHWTNAWQGDRPYNWAWWRLELEEAGTYEVFVQGNATWSVDTDVRYGVMDGSGVEQYVAADPTSAPWVSLGAFEFAAGGAQWVAIYDHQSAAPSANQHLVADAVRLVRIDLPDPDTAADTGARPDTAAADTDDTARADDTAPSDTASRPDDAPGGCGCGPTSPTPSWLLAAAIFTSWRSRRPGRPRASRRAAP